MPLAEVFTSVSYRAKKKKALMCAVRDSVSEAFSLEPEDVTVWLQRCPKKNLLSAGKKEQTTQFLIHCFSGRTMREKEKLYALLFARLVALGEPTDGFQLTIEESPKENWGLTGGLSAAVLFGSSDD